MSEEDRIDRTREPSLAELTAQLDSLRELINSKIAAIQEVMNERDRLYLERTENAKGALVTALSAAKDQTSTAFAASKEAISKAEEAQKAYNLSHNDLLRKMDTQHKDTMPRIEAEKEFDGWRIQLNEVKEDVTNNGKYTTDSVNNLRVEMMKEIQNLRESRSELGGKERATDASKTQQHWILGIIVSIVISLVSVALQFLKHN